MDVYNNEILDFFHFIFRFWVRCINCVCACIGFFNRLSSLILIRLESFLCSLYEMERCMNRVNVSILQKIIILVFQALFLSSISFILI